MKHLPSMRVLLLCLISAWSFDTFSSFESDRPTFPLLPTEVWLHILNYEPDSKLALTYKQLYARYKPCVYPLSAKVDFTDTQENTPTRLFFRLIAQNRLAVHEEFLYISLGNEGVNMEHFMHALNQNTEIKSLKLSDKTKLKAVQMFFPFLNVNTTINKLCLDHIKTKDNCAAQLKDFLCTNTTLMQLNLHWITSANKTIIALAEGLQKNKTLRVLNLCGNYIGDLGIFNFKNMLMVNTVLQELSLVACDIDDIRLNQLLWAVKKNNTLVKLILSRNANITPNSTPILADTITENKSLKVIDLNNCSLTTDCAQILSASLQHNTTLEKLDLQCNYIRGTVQLDPRILLHDNTNVLNVEHLRL